MKEKTNYGNWVPEKALYMLFGGAIILGVIAAIAQAAFHKPVIAIIAGVLGVLILLDIGCGAAALTVRCAKTFPKAQITAMDYWGVEWSYAKEQCEKNARIEGVADRISFQKGDAAKLDFADETFDAAVSNFVFHEVRTAKDKRDVVKEALRVVKKGGVFSFQDMFSQKALYGDMEQFVRELKAEGISEVHYIGNLAKKLDFIPGFVTAPWMISGMGIIYRRK
nr:class I SAM-dependent methyltransferase [uncultured Blautia sp.]